LTTETKYSIPKDLVKLMNKICGKTRIVNEVAAKLSITKSTVDEVYDAILDVAKCALSEGYRLNLQKIGTLHIVDRKERKTRNPQTGELMTIPKHKGVKFNISDTLKESINET
jgi:DNA-binding protein HU-beta